MIRTALLAFAAVLSVSGCASGGRRGQAGRWVDAEGWAALSGSRTQARERALADAQRRAVEKGAGVRVAAATVLEESVVRRQRLRSELDGYIERFEVGEERVEDGMLKVGIRALVRPNVPGAARPAPPEGSPALGFEAQGPAADGLRRSFLAAGFSVGSPAKAGYVVRGRADVRPVRDRRLAGLHSARARVVVEVVEPASGLVVASAVEEAAALSWESQAAEEQALYAAGAAAAVPVAAALSDLLWKGL